MQIEQIPLCGNPQLERNYFSFPVGRYPLVAVLGSLREDNFMIFVFDTSAIEARINREEFSQ